MIAGVPPRSATSSQPRTTRQDGAPPRHRSSRGSTPKQPAPSVERSNGGKPMLRPLKKRAREMPRPVLVNETLLPPRRAYFLETA